MKPRFKAALLPAALTLLAAAVPWAPAGASATGALTQFQALTGHLEPAYAGLGNDNELLCTACYQMPASDTESEFQLTLDTPYTYYTESSSGGWLKSYTYTKHQEAQATYTCRFTQSPELGHIRVNYSLVGDGLSYVTAVRVWARPLQGNSGWHTDAAIDDVFTLPFDNRDPEGQGAVLVGEIAGNAASGTVDGSGSLVQGQKYLFYLTVNLSSDFSNLPKLRDRLTRVGGRITSIGVTTDATELPYTGTFSYTTYELANGNEPSTTTTYGGWGSPTKPSRVTKTLTTSGTKAVEGGAMMSAITYDNAQTASMGTLGSRVLVPMRKTIFAPGDHYSKFYRIPSITCTTTGHLIAISDARKYYAHDVASDIDMLCRVSTDDGATWGPVQTIAQGEPRDKNGNALPVDANHVPLDISKMSCLNSLGYGDAATAPLPGGNVLVTMIGGGGLFSHTDAALKTYSYYCILNDQGQRITDLKPIPEELYKAYDKQYSSRGNIAPGNMCVIKHGPLAGKVMACIRVIGFNPTDPQNLGSDRSEVHGNFFVIYDPATDTWHNFHHDSQGSGDATADGDVRIFQSDAMQRQGGGWDDEAQLAELNTYEHNGHTYTALLMSIRSTVAPFRQFLIVNARYDEASGTYKGFSTREKVGEALTVSTGANAWATQGNCNMVNYEDADGTQYLLHTAISANNSAPRTGRSNLTVNFAQIGTVGTADHSLLNNETRSLTLTDGISLSDPLDACQETAQYSSIVPMGDAEHTIAFLHEEYPLGVYNHVSHKHDGSSNSDLNGDFLLRSVFMRLRIGDIIPGAEAPEVLAINAPAITPKTQTYDQANPSKRPDIVIRSRNTDAGVCMYYTLSYVSPSNLATILLDTDTEAREVSIAWSGSDGLQAQLGEKLNLTQPEDGSRIVVTARNEKGEAGNLEAQSVEVTENYMFATPVRRIIIQAHNTQANTGYGSPQLSAGGQRVGVNTPVTAGEGSQVNIVGQDGGKFAFEGFTLAASYNNLDREKLSEANTGGLDITMAQEGKELQFTVPAPAAVADNYDIDGDGNPDALCIHVWYSINGSFDVGVRSQVFTCFHGTPIWKDDDGDGQGTLQAEKFVSTSLVETSDAYHDRSMRLGVVTEKGLTLDVLRKRFYDSTRSILFPAGDGSTYKAAAMEVPYNAPLNDMDICVSVLPDNYTAANYSAVIMLAVEKNAAAGGTSSLASKHTYLRRADGSLVYALLEGQSTKTARLSDALKAGAVGTYPWYVAEGGYTLGAMGRDNMTASSFIDWFPHNTFKDIIATDTGADETEVGELAFMGVHFLNIENLEGYKENFVTENDRLYVVVYVITNGITDAEQLTSSTAGSGTVLPADLTAPRRADSAASGESPALYTLFHAIGLGDRTMLTGIEELTPDAGRDADAPVEYYDVLGRRVSRPEPGTVTIRRQGRHAEKQIVLEH